MQLLRILMLLTFIVPSCLLAKYSWVSRFDAGETGWYGFKSPLSRLTISNTTEVKYFPDSGSLKVDFEYSGAGSYLGMGSSTAYSRFKTDWSRFIYGGFVIYMKGTSDFPVNLGLKTRNGSYSIDLAVHPYWVKYSIPWQSFKLLNTAFDAFALKVENFELRPGGNTTVGPTTLYIEEFGFEDNIIKLEKAEMLDISGVVGFVRERFQ